MSYMHIPNLYQDGTILLFRHCYVLEKIHGTSAHIAWNQGVAWYQGGGVKHAQFAALFDGVGLGERFRELGYEQVVVYGEAYGGKVQGMRGTYGDALRFIAFEVKIGDAWLAVPQAAAVAEKLGLEFVPWCETATDLAALDALRDAPSEVSVRRRVPGLWPREGIVLRPPVEVRRNSGDRVIAKHKAAAFAETRTPRGVDPAKRLVLEEAQAIAAEWVTPMRLRHVLDALTIDGEPPGIGRMRDVIMAMSADVRREAGAEVVWSREVGRAVGAATAHLFRAELSDRCAQEAKR